MGMSNGTGSAPAIEIRGLTKRYKSGVVANDAIDLDVPRGIVFGLLGPNGAGKTTLIRQLTGELLPTSGEIRVAGIDAIQSPLRAKMLMGVVPQEAGTFNLLTPEEHLRIFGRLRGLNAATANERAEQLLSDLGLVDSRKQWSIRLSGGMKRKLLVGMGIIARPPLLILDEPTTGLDPTSRRAVWTMLQSLTSEGTTILLTTHYMEEAEALCDEVAIIGRGSILARGSVEEIRSLCRNRYKATYQDNGSSKTVYGETQTEVLSELETRGVVEFAVSTASLEDLYLELTGHNLEVEHGG
jgi:ABC-2 type transport system ATP-binding protein